MKSGNGQSQIQPNPSGSTGDVAKDAHDGEWA